MCFQRCCCSNTPVAVAVTMMGAIHPSVSAADPQVAAGARSKVTGRATQEPTGAFSSSASRSGPWPCRLRSSPLAGTWSTGAFPGGRLLAHVDTTTQCHQVSKFITRPVLAPLGEACPHSCHRLLPCTSISPWQRSTALPAPGATSRIAGDAAN